MQAHSLRSALADRTYPETPNDLEISNMNKTDVSRRKFLSTTALTLPVAAAAIPAAMDMTSPIKASAAAYPSIRQSIPNRPLPTRTIGSTTLRIAAADLPSDSSTEFSVTIQDYIDNHLPASGGTLIIPWNNTDNADPHAAAATGKCVYAVNTMRDQVPTGKMAHFAIQLRDNVRLQFEPGVILKAQPNNVDRAYMFNCDGVSNVEICNGWFIGERDKHTFTSGTDEHNFGISLSGSQQVTVRGCMVSDFTGDGICIAGGSATDIVLCDVVVTKNRRQALSIIGGNYVSLYDSEFSYTYGTAPENGIDIEPDSASTSSSNITIDNCIIKGNEGLGIQINNHESTAITSTVIQNCLISYNRWNGIGYQTSNGGSITGGSIIGNAIYQNGKTGLSLYIGPTGGAISGHLIGALYTDGDYTNSFANNNVLGHTIQYPNTTLTANYNGYYSSPDDVFASTGAQTGNTWRYNYYFTH